MKMRNVGCILIVVFLAITPRVDGAETAESIKEALANRGIKGGLIVHLGCGDGKMTASLRIGEGCVVHGVDPDAANVAKARKHVREQGVYGPVSIDRLYGDRLPYVDNLVRAIVVSDAGSVSREEIMRVVCPLGIAVIDGKPVVKPWPKEMGSWQQHFGNSGNNAVADDTLVGPPRHYQWIDYPEWSRAHFTISSISSIVSDKGRLYSIEDRASAEMPALPGKFFLICRDAFSGIELWRHRFPDWHTVKLYVKYTPVQLQRRLVVIGDKVFCTPGYNAPITAFDAATGKVLKKYRGTEQTQEFVYADGVLFAITGEPYDTHGIVAGAGDKSGPQGVRPGNVLGTRAFPSSYYGKPKNKIGNPKSELVVIDAESGNELWKKSVAEMRSYDGGTLGVCGGNVVYAQANKAVCLDSSTGKEKWNAPLKATQESRGGKKSGRTGRRLSIVASEKGVYVSNGKALFAFSMKDGSLMWQGVASGNHNKPGDVFVVDNAVWVSNGTALDAVTGKQIKKVIRKYPERGHGKCYRNRITSRWYISSHASSADFLSMDDFSEFPNPWARSTCGIGHLPCNGLLYMGPSACSCRNMVQLTAFNALATEPGLKSSGQEIPVKVEPRLERGPAFGKVKPSKEGQDLSNAWPTYRCNVQRGGCTQSGISAKLKPAWQTDLGSRPSAPVIAAGKVFVAAVDKHRLCALNAKNGKLVWSFTAGGRVDSPPTFHNGTVLFGSRDGWVYCLRADDGELVWRFKALPDRLICAYQQVESAWPVCGSILVQDNIAYFAAGRNTFLDGGIFIFALEPATGKIVNKRRLFGPVDKDGFAMDARAVTGAAGTWGNKGDIMVGDGEHVYLRHDAFTSGLEPAKGGNHLMASHSFTQPVSHHRSYWMLGSVLRYDTFVRDRQEIGDIMLHDGSRYYGIYGYVPYRLLLSDLRKDGYILYGADLKSGRKSNSGKKGKNSRSPDKGLLWKKNVPLTGRAMAKAGNVIFVAGTPMVFPEDDLSKAYDGRMGGVLMVFSAESGEKLAEYKLDAPPVWDSLAIAGGKLFLCTTDGGLRCYSGQ